MADHSGEIYVIDTSSLISVKEVIKPSKRVHVFDELTELCQQGRLVYPNEVFKELRRLGLNREDQIYLWRGHATIGVWGVDLELVRTN